MCLLATAVYPSPTLSSIITPVETNLLQTKLYIPSVRTSLVPRPHLVAKLAGIRPCKLILLSAPAGYGKTTLITEWIDQIQTETACTEPAEVAVCWLSLDEDDSDPHQFFNYLAAAIRLLTDIQSSLPNLLLSPQPQPAKKLMAAFVNDVVPVSAPFYLILDDYHAIDSLEIERAMAFLLGHMPPNMTLVITSRTDPGFPISRLRARGQLTELRANDLRFTEAETAQFLQQSMGLTLSTNQVAALESRTEGWIAGLQMAALSMQNRDDIDGFVASFTGSHRFIMDYLVEEVLIQQSAEVQEFLLKTAVLDRLCADLCNALVGKTSSTTAQQILAKLESHNIFLIPLDDDRHWYRYHHLFADLLRQRLRQTHPQQIPTLHSRASEWYEQNGSTDEAIAHSLQAKDFERAASLAELVWPAMSEGIQSIKWLSWLKELPDEFVRARPVLSLGYAWAFLNSGEMEAAEARLRDVERWLEPATDMSERPEAASTKPVLEGMVVVDEDQFRLLPVSLATARTYHAQAIGDVSGTIKYAQQILDLLPEGDDPWRGAASSLLGLAQYTSGDLEAAYHAFSNGLAGIDPLDAITGTFVLADIKMAQGQLHAAISICEHSLQLAIAHSQPMPLGTEDVYIGISKLHREQGDLEAAAQDLLTGKMLGEQIELPDWQHRWYIAQAQLKETLGDLDSALDLLGKAERCYVRTPVPNVHPIAAIKARIWVAQGRMAKVLSWAREQSLSVDDDLSYLREFEHVTLVRVLVARYKSDQIDNSIHEAIRLLERLLEAAEEGGRMGSVIEILALQALAFEARGDIPSALVSLERALTFAEPEGYVRIFVDEGLPMAKLLHEAADQSIEPDYARKLLAAFKPNVQSDTGASPQPLVEPLSERELEVLLLVAQGLINREIGERLFLALDTVKGHNRRIYGKLGVKNRAQAVNKAISLKIIPPQ